MFIDTLKADIAKGGVFNWHTDETLIYVAELLTERVVKAQDVTKGFEKFYRAALQKAPIDTLTRARFDAVRTQPALTVETTMHAQWFEFPEPLPGLEQWRGCLVAPMADPRTVFGPTAKNLRPTGVCCLMLFGDGYSFAVAHVMMKNGRLIAANIHPMDLSTQAIVSGSSRSQKQQEVDSITPLWKVVIALQ